MLAMLEANETARLERLLEGVYFVTRALELWTEALRETDKNAEYAKLTEAEKEMMPYEDFKPQTPAQVGHFGVAFWCHVPLFFPTSRSEHPTAWYPLSHARVFAQTTSALEFSSEPFDVLSWVPSPLFLELNVTTLRQQPEEVPHLPPCARVSLEPLPAE